MPLLPKRRDGATAVIEEEYGSYRMYASSGTNLGRGTVKIGSKLHGAVTVPNSAYPCASCAEVRMANHVVGEVNIVAVTIGCRLELLTIYLRQRR